MDAVVPDFSAVRALVVGDVMLDRYWQGDTARISPEAPVPVVRVTQTDDRPGGAGNVAVNLAALGARVQLLGVVGADEAGRKLNETLRAAGVEPRLLSQPGSATITKLRVMSRHQQLLRLDFEDGHHAYAAPELMAEFERALAQADVVIFSDYGKGTLRTVAPMIQLATRAARIVLVDPKGRDFERYQGATLMTPNLGEFEAVAGESVDEAELNRRAVALCQRLGLDRLLVTRGEHGMSLFAPDGQSVHLPARAREVYDVTGAGDTVISVLAASLAAGLDWVEAANLANIAAGLVVAKLGAATVSAAELRQAIHPEAAAHAAIVEEDQLLALVAAAHARGERIVMTNGCFDILHPGHVAYLEQARALGHRLIVAVNDDASVARLKGEDRPLNPLAARMRVLAALACVDWVVPFSEDTPERLICRVRPDWLVKGGDYQPDQIAGARCVLESGGQVCVLPYQPGHSTSALLARARGGESV